MDSNVSNAYWAQRVIDEGARVAADHQRTIDRLKAENERLRALLALTATFVDVEILKHNKIGEDLRIALCVPTDCEFENGPPHQTIGFLPIRYGKDACRVQEAPVIYCKHDTRVDGSRRCLDCDEERDAAVETHVRCYLCHDTDGWHLPGCPNYSRPTKAMLVISTHLDKIEKFILRQESCK